MTAEQFRALRSFLRGYLHQDMKQEYGSVEGAVEQFCLDANAGERAAVMKEWRVLLERLKGHSLAEINQTLTGALGSSYSLTEEELQAVSAGLAKRRKD